MAMEKKNIIVVLSKKQYPIEWMRNFVFFCAEL